MGSWSFYFFAKLALFANGSIGFHVLENFCFALFTALPVQARRWRIAKQAVAVPVGIALLHHDSWLPPVSRLLAQWDQLSGFSLPYVIDLAARAVNLSLLLTLLLMLLAHWLLSRKLRLSSFAFIGILAAPWIGVLSGAAVPITPLPEPARAGDEAAQGFSATAASLDERLDAFYRREQARQLRLPAAAGEDADFDILLLQVCSLSWDDLDLVDARQHPLMRRLDIRFDQFNAAATYSGPAAIRLLRGSCGQTPQEALYQQADPACLLARQFESAGFTPQWVMNHEGVFGNMRTDIAQRGGMTAPLFPLDGQAPVLKAFNGDTYYGDHAVLSAWWQQRLTLPDRRVLLYYNSGTLHDGNRFLDGRRLPPEESYRRRLEGLFGDLGRFFDELEASGRQVVVVLVPEHGANTRGDRLQMSGMREVPSPAIGLVPVGLRLIGGAAPPAAETVAEPSSYFGLSTLLGRFLARSPFAERAPPLADYLEDLPQTDFVAENEGVVIMRGGGRYWMRTADGRWSEYQSGP
jgi:cellulose synthase operon protein YhjU